MHHLETSQQSILHDVASPMNMTLLYNNHSLTHSLTHSEMAIFFRSPTR